MNTRPICSTDSTYSYHFPLTLLIGLLALVSACTGGRGISGKGQSLRLNVGDIKEITLSTRPDTTWQLTATSDNQEVVDVSRKMPAAAMDNATASPAVGQAVFLLKGITAGTSRVVFSEKRLGTDGDGQVKKTYVVTVVSK